MTERRTAGTRETHNEFTKRDEQMPDPTPIQFEYTAGAPITIIATRANGERYQMVVSMSVVNVHDKHQIGLGGLIEFWMLATSIR